MVPPIGITQFSRRYSFAIGGEEFEFAVKGHHGDIVAAVESASRLATILSDSLWPKSSLLQLNKRSRQRRKFQGAGL